MDSALADWGYERICREAPPTHGMVRCNLVVAYVVFCVRHGRMVVAGHAPNGDGLQISHRDFVPIIHRMNRLGPVNPQWKSTADASQLPTRGTANRVGQRIRP
jgi:hypothetical protein